jgi:hypothetical protein
MSGTSVPGSAGSGSPDSADPLLSTPSMSGADVIAPAARAEIDRIRRRWAELPVERARDAAPVIGALVTQLVGRFAAAGLGTTTVAASRTAAVTTAAGNGAVTTAAAGVSDLGPAVVVDQLTVLVWDSYATGHASGLPELLTATRRALP